MCSLLTETPGGIFIAPTSWIKRPSGREVNELCWVTHVEMNLAPPTPHWLGGRWTAKGGDTGPGEAWQPAARSPAAQLPCWGVYSLCRGQGAGLPEAGRVGCGGEPQTRTGWPACSLTRRPVDRRHCPPRCSLRIQGGLPCRVEAGLTAVLRGGWPCAQPGPEALTLKSLLPGPHPLQLGLL